MGETELKVGSKVVFKDSFGHIHVGFIDSTYFKLFSIYSKNTKTLYKGISADVIVPYDEFLCLGDHAITRVLWFVMVYSILKVYGFLEIIGLV